MHREVRDVSEGLAALQEDTAAGTPAHHQPLRSIGLGILPNVIPYSLVISACGRGGMPARVLQLCDEMQLQGLRPNGFTYSQGQSSPQQFRYRRRFQLAVRHLRTVCAYRCAGAAALT